MTISDDREDSLSKLSLSRVVTEEDDSHLTNNK